MIQLLIYSVNIQCKIKTCKKKEENRDNRQGDLSLIRYYLTAILIKLFEKKVP